MPVMQASRRLVKSPPELWAEVSDAASLARHLGEVGEITITRLEPETTVAWEGERASGTVELAPAGWGTSVTLTAEPAAEIAATPASEPAAEAATPPAPGTADAEPGAVADPQPGAVADPEPGAVAEPEPVPEPQREPAAEPETIGVEEAAAPTRAGWFARLFRRRPAEPVPGPRTEPEPSATDADPKGGGEDARPLAGRRADALGSDPTGPARGSAEPAAEEPPATEPGRSAPERAREPLETLLVNALDSLGQAHHRPFSRG